MSSLKQHILAALAKGIRLDGRKFEEIRDISVEYGISRSAEGSARVTIGETIVLAGVKLAVEKPYPDTADKGNLMVNAELMALSNPRFELGPPSMESIELARVVDRGIRESGAVDFEKLCIKEGEKVWSVMVDICTINAAGNLIDASALAAIAAIKDARFPKFDGTAVDYMEKTDEKLPVEQVPIAITVHRIGSSFLVDLLVDEEDSSDARLTVTTIDKGIICSLQKGGDSALSIDEIDRMIAIAQEKAKELRQKL